MISDPKDEPHPLLVQVQKLFQKELALENDYLRQENKILRSKFGRRVPLDEVDRRILVKYGMRIKDRLADVVSILKPKTILDWNRRMKAKKSTYDTTPKNPGRPPKGKETEDLVVKLALENNHWGCRKIAGERRKLGHTASREYVRDVLKRHGIPPAPNRKGLSWKQFIASHMDVIWATDFFTEEVWTRGGLVTYYVLFYIHLGTRRVHIAGCTPHPNASWTSQQARNFYMMLDDVPEQCRYLIHDGDGSFQPFDPMIKSEGMKVVKTPPRTPKCNAFAERHVREIRETLNNMILLGEGHLRHVLKRIEYHHNHHRPHQGRDNLIPLGFKYPEEPGAPDNIRCESVLGGLLKHYHVADAA